MLQGYSMLIIDIKHRFSISDYRQEERLVKVLLYVYTASAHDSI